MSTRKPKLKNFEDAMQQLDALVERVENGQLPLEEMLDTYKEGVSLIRQCRERLNVAEMEIKKLEQGELTDLEDDGGN